MNAKTLITLLSTPRAFALALFIAGAIVVLQYHGVQFWSENGAGVSAIGFTVLLELGALIAWSSETTWHRWTLGLAATALLLAGPLFVVSKEVVKEWQTDSRADTTTSQKRNALEADIKSLQEALSTYLANAKLAAIGALMETEGNMNAKKIDWAGMAATTQASLDAKNTALLAVINASATPAKRTDWQVSGIIGMQVLTLIVLQLMVVAFINELRTRAASLMQPVQQPAAVISETVPTITAHEHPHPAPETMPEEVLPRAGEPFLRHRKNWLHRAVQ